MPNNVHGVSVVNKSVSYSSAASDILLEVFITSSSLVEVPI